MKLTNKEILEIVPDLIELQRSSTVLPPKISYAILRNIKTLGPIYDDIETCRTDIAERHSDKMFPNSKGQIMYNIPDSQRKEVSKQINSLLSIENDLNLRTFSLDDLANCDLDMKSMNALYFMIESEG